MISVHSCFISDIGVFFGALFVPMLLLILFNTSVFIVVVMILIRHNIKRTKENLTKSSLPLSPREACKLILSLSGIMILLGLTWFISFFTFVGVDTNHDAAFALQWLFVFFNSLQGFFLFVFFVLLSSDARKEWLKVICTKSQSYSTSEMLLARESRYVTSGTLKESCMKEKQSYEMANIEKTDELKKGEYP